MTCDARLLSAFLDGDVSARRASRVRAHLQSCAGCRAELAALESLRGALSSLPEPSRDEAPDDWLLVQQKLAAAAAPARRPTSWRRWVLAPGFAAVAAAALWVHHHRLGPSDDVLIAQAESEFRGAESQYVRALDKLRGVAQRARGNWPESRRREYDAAQAALEAATEQCRAVARNAPADADAEEVLFAAYRKQIHFFEEQLLRAEAVRQ
jgi:hypothetical protein